MVCVSNSEEGTLRLLLPILLVMTDITASHGAPGVFFLALFLLSSSPEATTRMTQTCCYISSCVNFYHK